MSEPRIMIEEVTDPEENERARVVFEAVRRNTDWLQAHWPDLLPHAKGRHLAVAGQEAYVADTPEEAWSMAMAAHPDDPGAILQYVIPHPGPRIYANRG